MGGSGTAVRRVGFGLSMILAPLLWLASAALGPPHRASKHLADVLPYVAADPDRYLAFTLVGVLSLALFVPAVLGVAHVLREQRPLLALSGAALAVVGILSSAVIHGVQFVQQQMIDVAADRGQMVALLQRTEAGIGLKVIFAGFILGRRRSRRLGARASACRGRGSAAQRGDGRADSSYDERAGHIGPAAGGGRARRPSWSGSTPRLAASRARSS